MVRTPRSVQTETCQYCNGKGHVTRYRPFELWTPEECLVAGISIPTLELPSGSMDAYVCRTSGGAHILDTCIEAQEIARTVGRSVAFTFNEVVVVVHADEDPAEAVKRWKSVRKEGTEKWQKTIHPELR